MIYPHTHTYIRKCIQSNTSYACILEYKKKNKKKEKWKNKKKSENNLYDQLKGTVQISFQLQTNTIAIYSHFSLLPFFLFSHLCLFLCLSIQAIWIIKMCTNVLSFMWLCCPKGVYMMRSVYECENIELGFLLRNWFLCEKY